MSYPTPSSNLTDLIPPPYEDWNGLRQPDYTQMYWEYTEPLYYLRITMPIGVLGHYIWIANLIVLLEAIWVSATGEKSWAVAAENVLAYIYLLVETILDIQSISACGARDAAAGGRFSPPIVPAILPCRTS